MDYILISLLGMAGGAFCVFMLTEAPRKALQKQKREQEVHAQEMQSAFQAMKATEERYAQEHKLALEHQAREAQRSLQAIKLTEERYAQEHKLAQEHQAREAQKSLQAAKTRDEQFDQEMRRFKAEQAEFDARRISYDELHDENTILKRDLRNICVQVRKVQLDAELLRKSQDALRGKVNELGSRYLKENVKWIGTLLTPNNFAVSKQRLHDVIERCRGIGFEISGTEEATLQNDLKGEYQMVVRAAFEREEQARIKAQIREEQLREREIERELKQLEREREAIKAALDKALADAEDQHSEEVGRLRTRLAEAEEKSRRAISQAQLTKSGHVYVISNVGSFGDGVFKVGMTRRLEPGHRILELGSASVPFPFDVHMMISSNDAPALENALHRKLFRLRINKTNPRKEFFRTDIAAIYQIVKEHHGEVEYSADAEALQYRQSLTMTDEDQEFVENVYNALEEDEEVVPDDI